MTACCFTRHRPDKLPWGNRQAVPSAGPQGGVEGVYLQGLRLVIFSRARAAWKRPFAVTEISRPDARILVPAE